MNRRLIAFAFAWQMFCCSSLQRPATIYGSEPPLKPVTLADVVEALEKRERATAMVELRWTHSVRYEPGSLLAREFAKSMELQGNSLLHGVPAEPVAFRYPSELRLKGEQMEFVSKRLRVDPPDASLSMIDYRSAYDGRESKFQMGSSPGTILPVRGNTDVTNLHLLPILLYYRPLDDTFAVLRKKTLKLSGRIEQVDGHQCLRVDDGRTRVDLDCERGLIPVAFQRYWPWNGKLFLDGHIEYAPHRTLLFVPKRFEVKQYSRPSQIAETFSGDIAETHWAAPAR
jgi:hypothetical protein